VRAPGWSKTVTAVSVRVLLLLEKAKQLAGSAWFEPRVAWLYAKLRAWLHEQQVCGRLV